MDELIPIQNLIYEIRGHKVMLDSDLARLYGVETKVLNQSVKRNIKRFPTNFMFQLNKEEWRNLRSQFVTFSNDSRKFLPFAFTEQGVAMLSSILRSEKAIQINIHIMNTFVQMRKYALSQTSKNSEIDELRKMLMLHIDNTDNRFNENEATIRQIINVLNNLIEKPRETKQIGFNVSCED